MWLAPCLSQPHCVGLCVGLIVLACVQGLLVPNSVAEAAGGCILYDCAYMPHGVMMTTWLLMRDTTRGRCAIAWVLLLGMCVWQ